MHLWFGVGQFGQNVCGVLEERVSYLPLCAVARCLLLPSVCSRRREEPFRWPGAAKGPTFASALVVDGRYLCSCARVCACESRVLAG